MCKVGPQTSNALLHFMYWTMQSMCIIKNTAAKISHVTVRTKESTFIRRYSYALQ